MKNWKTTVCGLVAAIASYVVANPNQFTKWPYIGTIAGFVVAGGLAGIGVFAKDATTHSTETEVEVATSAKQAQDLKAVQ